MIITDIEIANIKLECLKVASTIHVHTTMVVDCAKKLSDFVLGNYSENNVGEKLLSYETIRKEAMDAAERLFHNK